MPGGMHGSMIGWINGGGLVKGGLLGLLRGVVPDKHAWWYG